MAVIVAGLAWSTVSCARPYIAPAPGGQHEAEFMRLDPLEDVVMPEGVSVYLRVTENRQTDHLILIKTGYLQVLNGELALHQGGKLIATCDRVYLSPNTISMRHIVAAEPVQAANDFVPLLEPGRERRERIFVGGFHAKLK